MEIDIIGEPRLESISKMKISHPMSFNKLNGDFLVEATDLIFSYTSAELARVTVNTEVDHKNIGLSKRSFRLGSGTKIDKFQDLLKICFLFIFLCFSTLGADEFREIIKTRWRELRSKSTDPEQTWLIPQPSRSSWGDSREFNKVNLVREMIGYKPRINNKNNAKCMDTYLKGALELELVITKLGLIKDYLPVDAHLLDYLTTDTEGPTGWKYPKLEG